MTRRKRPVPQRDWRYRAACRNATPDEQAVMITGYNGRDQATWMRAAVRLNKRYCAVCPVADACRRWAEGETGFTGLAGGTVFQFRRVRRHWRQPRVRRMVPLGGAS